MSLVLLVDDNQSLATFTAMNLEMAIPELQVMVAATCQQARELASSRTPTVLVVDRLLPDGDGLALQAELVQRFPRMRTIVVTAQVTKTCENMVVGGAVHGVFNKPYEAEELTAAVREALVLSARSAADERAAQVDPPCQPLRPDHRHRVLNRLSTVLTNLRYLEGELRRQLDDPSAIRDLLDEHVDTIAAMVREIALIVATDN